jgi:hypothetical protein
MRTLALVFFTAPTLAMLLLSCDSNAPLEPAAITDLPLAAAASGAELQGPTSATAVSSSESQIDITWQDGSSNETKFEVHRSTTGESGVFTLLATTGPNLVAYHDRGLEPGTQYCYRIRAARVVSAVLLEQADPGRSGARGGLLQPGDPGRLELRPRLVGAGGFLTYCSSPPSTASRASIRIPSSPSPKRRLGTPSPSLRDWGRRIARWARFCSTA